MYFPNSWGVAVVGFKAGFRVKGLYLQFREFPSYESRTVVEVRRAFRSGLGIRLRVCKLQVQSVGWSVARRSTFRLPIP